MFFLLISLMISALSYQPPVLQPSDGKNQIKIDLGHYLDRLLGKKNAGRYGRPN